MIAKAYEFEYTCIVKSNKDAKVKLNDGIYTIKQLFETEIALLNCIRDWTSQGYSGVYRYLLSPENIENNLKQKSFPIDVYDKFSDCPGLPERFITAESFSFYAKRK